MLLSQLPSPNGVRPCLYLDGMPSSLPPCGHCCLSADALNDEIRRLMAEPDTPERRDRYQQLLAQWCALVAPDVEPAA